MSVENDLSEQSTVFNNSDIDISDSHYKSEISRLTSELQIKNDRIKIIEEEKKGLIEEIHSIKKRYDENLILQQTLENNRNIEELSNQNNNEIKNLKINFEKKNNDLNNLEKEIEKYKNEIENYKMKLEHKEEIHQKDIEILILEEEKKNLKSEIFDLDESKIDSEMIRSKTIVYNNLFVGLGDELEVKKKILDKYYKRYRRLNASIQLTIIYFSIFSSFLQALDVNLYNVLFGIDDFIFTINNYTLNNITYLEKEYESNIEENFNLYIDGYTLFISMYTAFLIACERHYKFQQKENSIEILKDGYSEPISLVNNSIQELRPWLYKQYYMKSITHEYDYDDFEINKKFNELNLDSEKMKDWMAFLIKIDKQFQHIIELKKALDSSYGKLINLDNKIEKKLKKNDTISELNYKSHLPSLNYKYKYNSAQVKHIKQIIKEEVKSEKRFIRCKLFKYKKKNNEIFDKDDNKLNINNKDNLKYLVKKEINESRCCNYILYLNCRRKKKKIENDVEKNNTDDEEEPENLSDDNDLDEIFKTENIENLVKSPD